MRVEGAGRLRSREKFFLGRIGQHFQCFTGDRAIRGVIFGTFRHGFCGPDGHLGEILAWFWSGLGGFSQATRQMCGEL